MYPNRSAAAVAPSKTWKVSGRTSKLTKSASRKGSGTVPLTVPSNVSCATAGSTVVPGTDTPIVSVIPNATVVVALVPFVYVSVPSLKTSSGFLPVNATPENCRVLWSGGNTVGGTNAPQ